MLDQIQVAVEGRHFLSTPGAAERVANAIADAPVEKHDRQHQQDHDQAERRRGPMLAGAPETPDDH